MSMLFPSGVTPWLQTTKEVPSPDKELLFQDVLHRALLPSTCSLPSLCFLVGLGERERSLSDSVCIWSPRQKVALLCSEPPAVFHKYTSLAFCPTTGLRGTWTHPSVQPRPDEKWERRKMGIAFPSLSPVSSCLYSAAASIPFCLLLAKIKKSNLQTKKKQRQKRAKPCTSKDSYSLKIDTWMLLILQTIWFLAVQEGTLGQLKSQLLFGYACFNSTSPIILYFFP